MDGDGNLRGADIGITWEDNETFLHGVREVGPDPSRRPSMRPAMSTPHQPMGGRHRDDSPTTVHQPTRPVMSTPYQPTLGQDRDLGSSSVRPVTPEVDYQMRRPPTETRQGYRPAAPIQRFNNKSLNCPAWFASALFGKDHLEEVHVHNFSEGRGYSFHECLRRFGLEWFRRRSFFDQRGTTGQTLWMDLALARKAGQELHNDYVITNGAEFGSLKSFFRACSPGACSCLH